MTKPIVNTTESTAIAESSASTPLEAGRELDALVAEKVMGWRWYRSEATGKRALFGDSPPEWFKKIALGGESLATAFDCRVPHYSTDISAAWSVVEKMRAGGYAFDLSDCDDCYWAAFENIDIRTTNATAKTAPHAICLASLAFLAALTRPNLSVPA